MHQTWGIELGLHLGISTFRCCNCLKLTSFLWILLSVVCYTIISTAHCREKYLKKKGNKCNLSITPLFTVSLECDASQKSTVVAKNDIGKTRSKKR